MPAMLGEGGRLMVVESLEEFRNILTGKSVQISIALTAGFVITSKFIRYRQKSQPFSLFEQLTESANVT